MCDHDTPRWGLEIVLTYPGGAPAGHEVLFLCEKCLRALTVRMGLAEEERTADSVREHMSQIRTPVVITARNRENRSAAQQARRARERAEA